jgi:hypothetical protein
VIQPWGKGVERYCRLLEPLHLSRDDHHCKIRARTKRSDVRKFSFVNRTIADWNKLPEEIFVFPPAKVHAFSKRVNKAVERL